MIELKSMSKPTASALESASAESTERKVLEGGSGSKKSDHSRAVEKLVVTGKGDPIERNLEGFAGALESVIGTDSRERILETDLLPWRMICALRMFSDGGGGAIGTGWLVGPRTIITAGHCVHHMGFFGGWADKIEISAGRDGSDFPFGTVTATRFSSVDKWVADADPDFDIGCIHLDDSVGDSVGWFSIASLPPKALKSHMVNVSGYPGDRGAGTEQYFHKNRILNVGNRRVFYDVDTAGGQSGAPVWIHEKKGAPPLVVGIHAYGTGGTPFDLGITANSAPRIIPEMFDQIAGWIEADNDANNGA
jgi:glutamyl endopeptidase